MDARRLVVCASVLKAVWERLFDHNPCWCWFTLYSLIRALPTLIYLVLEERTEAGVVGVGECSGNQGCLLSWGILVL